MGRVRRRCLVAALVVIPGLSGAAGLHTVNATAPSSNPSGEVVMSLVLRSSEFEHGGAIPRRFTCEGDDVSPPLAWSDVPPGTKALALIVDDPDAPDPAHPRRTWVHWVLYDIPPASAVLATAVKPSSLPQGTREGVNDWGRTGYGGPCPPIGRHRYFFKLYALDAHLGDLHRPTKAELEQAMEGHVVAHTELMGTYQKAR
jgi:hypothetical protein